MDRPSARVRLATRGRQSVDPGHLSGGTKCPDRRFLSASRIGRTPAEGPVGVPGVRSALRAGSGGHAIPRRLPDRASERGRRGRGGVPRLRSGPPRSGTAQRWRLRFARHPGSLAGDDFCLVSPTTGRSLAAHPVGKRPAGPSRRTRGRLLRHGSSGRGSSHRRRVGAKLLRGRRYERLQEFADGRLCCARFGSAWSVD